MTSPRWHAGLNRCRDSLQEWLTPRHRGYRRKLLHLLDDARRKWHSADYGSGYLYQSFPRLGLRGFRRTDDRVEQMDIVSALKGRSVLEIGCNSGFLSLTLSPVTKSYVAFDNNPYLIEIARLTQSELGDGNVDFRVDTMEAFPLEHSFDIVLSFANHSTWDGNMSLDLDTYFAKLRALLVEDGTLFFESHHPALENGERLRETLQVMQKYFRIDSQRKLQGGSAWDRGRTFVRATAH